MYNIVINVSEYRTRPPIIIRMSEFHFLFRGCLITLVCFILLFL